MVFRAIILGGCLVPSLFLCMTASADTLHMKDGSEMKGLIVEQHEDRVIINTEQGELPVMRDVIREIEYDDPPQTFLQIGESHERSERWGEALAYYEKALEIQPDLEEAKSAIIRVRNRFWSKSAAGPSNEVDRMQSRYDARGVVKTKSSAKEKSGTRSRDAIAALEAGLGLSLEKKDDWVAITKIAPRSDALLAGLKKGDRLVSLDGRSLRYLSADVVRDKLLLPSRSIFTLELERDGKLLKTGFEKNVSEFGLKVVLETRGTVITGVTSESRAARAGLKENDLLVTVNGVSMRYTPLNKLLKVLLEGPSDRSVLSVRRSVTMTRK